MQECTFNFLFLYLAVFLLGRQNSSSMKTMYKASAALGISVLLASASKYY